MKILYLILIALITISILYAGNIDTIKIFNLYEDIRNESSP
jgi:hypothetical protein